MRVLKLTKNVGWIIKMGLENENRIRIDRKRRAEMNKNWAIDQI